jgi:hypothetical protein
MITGTWWRCVVTVCIEIAPLQESGQALEAVGFGFRLLGRKSGNGISTFFSAVSEGHGVGQVASSGLNQLELNFKASQGLSTTLFTAQD